MSNGFETLDNDTLLSIIQPDLEQGNHDDDLIAKIAQQKLIDSIDTKTGAPANVRASVSAAQKPNDKLATLKNFYPDAVPVEVLDPEHGAVKFGRGNFVFTNQENGQLTLFDEDLRLFGMPVPGLRDFVDVGPEIAETAGAIGGAIGGGIAGAPGGPVGVGAGIVQGGS